MPRFAELALNVPLFSLFTYQLPDGTDARAGMRAQVRFGNRKLIGVITAAHDGLPENCPVGMDRIRRIERILDDEPLLTEELLELGRWMSRYYLCPPGEALAALIPSGRRESGVPGFPAGDDGICTVQNELSQEQRAAVDGILGEAEVPSRNFHYLYGATGSGKTEVFLTAARRLLSEGKGVIYLVPEIGLTPQVAEAVVARFGQTAAVLHSGLTPSQRLAEWKRILRREARVVIGARSAVFAPVPALGLVIIDEEHDASYKSGSSPRYHARQVAMHRCARLKIPLVMGSATPSAEAWHAMQSGGLARHTLTRRLAGGAAPQIRAVDVSRIPPDSGCISPQLAQEVRRALAAGRQSILFLNRRGFTHFFRCSSCGFELTCMNCSVPLTYHKAQGRLRCHYCGWSTEPPSSCPQCGSLDVGYAGFGTEFIESEVRAKFPSARVLRVDTDSVSRRGELQARIDSFRKGEYDILLGTQMVAKGLNFPSLQLVGVVSADTGLHMPDFRAAERTFALITQVAGRAGRFFPDGKVIVQSFAPSRQPIDCAVRGDIERFYEEELRQRELLGFPPYSRLIRLVFRSPAPDAAEIAAQSAAHILQSACKNGHARTEVQVLGPSECPIAVINRSFRWQLILRGKDMGALLAVCRMLVLRHKAPGNVHVEVDVDPVGLL